ncbi:MAG: ATP-binding protein [Alistipes indistinctus]
MRKRTFRAFSSAFSRVDKSRSREQGGTGLGLAIVKHILDAHGQGITLRSKPGRREHVFIRTGQRGHPSAASGQYPCFRRLTPFPTCGRPFSFLREN